MSDYLEPSLNFFRFLTLIGGLALFLFGMDYMGKSLTSLSGSRLKTILGSLTANRFRAVGLGTLVTALIQSSSGTTVMMVGLVNSGVMTLRQAIGVLMGANVGTTVTAWILSLAGIESNNFFLSLLKPSSFAPILAIVGTVFILLSKDEKRRNLAGIFLGFAILIFGMDAMSGAMAPLANDPGFQKLFLTFSNPLLGILVGAVLTAVIQSSSASVGILQALSASGMVGMSAAFPIILGQNIGTCITAMLSAIGAQRNAKRAATVHLLFNLIGTVLAIVVVYGLGLFLPMPFLGWVATPALIALAHSVFNLGNTAVLINFIPQLEKLAFLIIPETEEERQAKIDVFQVLDDRLLDTPSIALEQSRRLSGDMLELAQDLVERSLLLISQYDAEEFDRLKRQETLVDRYEDELGTYLLRVSALKLTEGENNQLTTMLHSIGDFERMADMGWNIVLAARELDEKGVAFSPYAMSELNVYFQALKDILSLTREAYATQNLDIARKIEPLEEAIDVLNDQLRLRHVQRLKNGLCSIDLGFVLANVLNAIERISDHCSNIAALMLELSEKTLDTHKYLRRVRKKSNVQFQEKVAGYLDLYALPEPAASLWEEFMEEGLSLPLPDRTGDKQSTETRPLA